MTDKISVDFRRYEEAWQTIAMSDKPVRYKVPVSFQRTFIQAIRKEKSIANVRRKSMDMPAYGKLDTEVKGDIVTFTLRFNGDLL